MVFASLNQLMNWLIISLHFVSFVNQVNSLISILKYWIYISKIMFKYYTCRGLLDIIPSPHRGGRNKENTRRKKTSVKRHIFCRWKSSINCITNFSDLKTDLSCTNSENESGLPCFSLSRFMQATVEVLLHLLLKPYNQF